MSSLIKGYTRISFRARISHSYLHGLRDLENSILTKVLMISFRARSVITLSLRHCSTSGRQCSGILISSWLETDEIAEYLDEETLIVDGVDTEEVKLELPG